LPEASILILSVSEPAEAFVRKVMAVAAFGMSVIIVSILPDSVAEAVISSLSSKKERPTPKLVRAVLGSVLSRLKTFATPGPSTE